MTTPTIRILFEVFIGQGIFKGTAMQVQGYHISSGERVLRQGRQEQLVDDPVASHSHPTLARRGRMRGDHDPARLPRRTQSQVWTVVESPHDPADRGWVRC
jgi:hypothetical protein